MIYFAFFFIHACYCNNPLKKENSEETRSTGIVLGTYNSLPRHQNGKANISELIKELKDLNANTYNWLIWKNANDWEDLKRFLPIAKSNNITVWVTIVPPSESKPKAQWNSEPYGMDYIKWAQEIAKLSLQYPNLTTLSIDDFAHNLSFYTPQYVKEMVECMKEINPNLCFVPCVYYKQLTLDFAKNYELYLDGILFPYRAESEVANLKNATLVESEIAYLTSLFGDEIPIYIDVYLTAHSTLGASTPSYVRDVIRSGRKFADGVLIYTHPNPVTDAEKYQIVKSEFLSKE
jgi:hypothetical protein